VRADVAYLHAETLGWDMHSSRDRSSDTNGAAISSTAGFVSAVLGTRSGRRVAPYVIGGIGLGWVNAMRGTTYTDQDRGTIGPAWQGGGGVEWTRGRRAIRLESRLQSIRSAGVTGWYTTVPLTIGVRF
jgi:opacity protein-like surface antigen